MMYNASARFHVFLMMVALLLSSSWALRAVAAPVDSGKTAKSVVELFTSQGCSSCPPADIILGRLADRSDVIALSFSVDYWDYLGWRDTLASRANTDRQRSYARARGGSQVYTPQMVVDGVEDAVGNNEGAIEQAVEKARDALDGKRVPVSIRADGDALVIEVGAAPEGAKPGSATLWLAMVSTMEWVKIKRGENRGRGLAYHHVVRRMMPVGMWKGEATTVRLPRQELKRQNADLGVALLQVDGYGPVIGAAEITIR